MACGSKNPSPQEPAVEPPPATATTPNPTDPPPSVVPTTKPAVAQRLAEDTPSTTVTGNPFIAPAGWSIAVRGAATIIEAPEGNSFIALVDVKAKDAEAAIAAAWAAYRPSAKWPLKAVTAAADKDGWTDQKSFAYQTSPNERRDVVAGTMRHGDQWTVWIYDMAQDVGEKRLGAIELVFGRLFPKGYSRESFAGRKANVLDAARIKQLTDFVERSQKALGVPGVSLGLIQNGKVIFEGGFGVKELGKPAKPDASTLYIIASNTKSMTTLMLAKLIDEKKLTWETPVTSVFPQFKLGDAETTSKVLVKHLVCACTGLPRQDFEWLLEFKNRTPATALETLGTMQPTSKFGEMFQYSNALASAGGYVGGYVLFPKKELGAAYDEAMKTRVFGPLGMSSTTFDFKRALRANHATAHALDIDGKPALAAFDVNYSILPVRPAGGAWSNVKDVLKYVRMELAKGKLPNGKQYITEQVLLDRRTPQVSIGKDEVYAIGLGVSTKYGTPVVSHGGSMIGYKTQMFWLPEHDVGVVILTNADPGWSLHSNFQRKFLEVLFDGKAEADNDVAAAAKAMQERIAAERKLLTVPADKEASAKLAARYTNGPLGEITVTRTGDRTVFDVGEWKSPMASRKNPDGTVSFLTIVPGFEGVDFVVGETGGKRTLTFRDAQHEYVFTESK
ncbi:MAG: beta-lactamase family protein [Deltaproteobacteria bacterium]|nr:beta-lactamase family protein [Deltaproteobacteria bacterium]